jgi:hypothetical protein
MQRKIFKIDQNLCLLLVVVSVLSGRGSLAEESSLEVTSHLILNTTVDLSTESSADSSSASDNTTSSSSSTTSTLSASHAAALKNETSPQFESLQLKSNSSRTIEAQPKSKRQKQICNFQSLLLHLQKCSRLTCVEIF